MKIAAQPFEFEFDVAHTALVIIDMQRDFIEPGGFGETLGNDVSLLEAIVPACQAALAAWRGAGGWVVHTREAHKPDLSDCPPAKRNRGNPRLRIGDAGPMGRILVAGEPGNQIIDALAPVAGELVIDKPGKGAFYATGLASPTGSSRKTSPKWLPSFFACSSGRRLTGTVARSVRPSGSSPHSCR